MSSAAASGRAESPYGTAGAWAGSIRNFLNPAGAPGIAHRFSPRGHGLNSPPTSTTPPFWRITSAWGDPLRRCYTSDSIGSAIVCSRRAFDAGCSSRMVATAPAMR
jgi:hypothetical protein